MKASDETRRPSRLVVVIVIVCHFADGYFFKKSSETLMNVIVSVLVIHK